MQSQFSKESGFNGTRDIYEKVGTPYILPAEGRILKVKMYYSRCNVQLNVIFKVLQVQWRTEGGLGVQSPPPEIPKALQNRAKLNPIVKTVKNC